MFSCQHCEESIMKNTFSYMITTENCNESYQEIKVEVIGDLPMDLVKDVRNICMFDKWHDWFRPTAEEVEFKNEGFDMIGENKFIEYDLKDGSVCTVVFSKLVNHDHMDAHIGRILRKDRRVSFGESTAKRAGFICGTSKFGKSESLRVDHKGNVF